MSMINFSYKKATAFKDFKKLEEVKEVDASDPKDKPVSLKSIKETLDYLNKMIRDLNFRLKHTSLSASFDCDIVKVTIPASSSLKIKHGLKIVPRYRLILRQSGGGAITDVDSGWDVNYIELSNAGATDAVITIGIYKE